MGGGANHAAGAGDRRGAGAKRQRSIKSQGLEASDPGLQPLTLVPIETLLPYPVAIPIHAEQHILAALVFILRLFDRERREAIAFADVQDRDALGRATEQRDIGRPGSA